MFRGNISLGTKVMVDVDNNGSQNTEEETKSKHNSVSDTLTQRRLVSEERVLVLVAQEGWFVFRMEIHGGKQLIC